MGIAEDLLTLARRLASPAPTEPQQTSYRRAISTAWCPLIVVLTELENVAQALVDLRQAHHDAYPDNAKPWASQEVESFVEDTQFAFDNWTTIRTHPAANEYLLSLLVGNKRE
ncbi:MAG: hypothetical protein JOZ32_00450 [Bryobacterales bacterium]|nr:hypothetical protein [Bryobacterales bacterium]